MKALGCGGQVAEVCYAKVQGQQACIDHFKNAKFPVLDLDCLPIEFRHMVRLQHLLKPAALCRPGHHGSAQAPASVQALARATL